MVAQTTVRWLSMNVKPLILFALLAGCADFPALDRAVPAEATRGAYPKLLPLDAILTQSDALQSAGRLTPAVVGDVLTRAQALRAQPAVAHAGAEALSRAVLEHIRQGDYRQFRITSSSNPMGANGGCFLCEGKDVAVVPGRERAVYNRLL